MIARTWRARAAADAAHLYPQHLAREVLPKLQALDGFLGAYLLRRDDGAEVEFVVQTLWASHEAIGRFAGAQPEVAVVEPEAAAVLLSYDRTVTHHEVVLSP